MANARLFCAAPELLAALENTVITLACLVSKGCPGMSISASEGAVDALNVARQAIVKATGGEA
jgi:hypothetical protein